MKRTIAVVMPLFLFGFDALPQSAVCVTIDRTVEGYTEHPAGRFGLFFQLGLLRAGDLFIEETSVSEERVGIPLGGGLFYSIGKHVTGGIEAAYAPFPEWFELWGAHETWSIVEFNAYLKYHISPSAKIHGYGKAGLKVASLSGTQKPGEGLFGGLIGSDIRIRTVYAPGWESAVGITGTPSKKHYAMYVEIVFSYLHMKGKNVKVISEGADWKYPSDVKLIGVRTGVLVSL